MRTRQHRPGFTLVELLVVIAIIAFIGALTALYFPRYSERESVSRGADSLQGWLLMAKQQAKRDGLPTGLRLYVEGSTPADVKPSGAKVVRRLAFIQQPDDVAQGKYVGFWKEDGAQPATAWFRLPVVTNATPPTPPTRVQFGTARLPVQPGDYLEVLGTGIVHRIKAVRQTGPPDVNGYLELDAGTAPLAGTEYTRPTMPYASITEFVDGVVFLKPKVPQEWLAYPESVNYRIIRQPIPMPGEQELTLPEGVYLDMTETGNVGSRGVSQTKTSAPIEYEILFAPSGALIGRGTGNGQAIFWIRDGKADTSVTNTAGYGTLITVQPRTGFIAAHPVATGSDPYSFTKDSRSSGL